MQKILDLLKRFRNDERGAFLALFGVLAVVLIATAGATVDFTSVQNARTRAQVALDAAALALQPEIYDDEYTTEEIRAASEALMIDRLNDASIEAEVTSALPDLDNDTLSLTATLTVDLHFVALVGISEMSMTLVSQATRGSQDLEIAVALDVTGSMGNDISGTNKEKIEALIDAANDLVDTLVLEEQEPTYTKMALIPYSMGVNVGSYAASVRGAIPAAKTITAAAWQTGSNRTITAISKASQAVVTTSGAHGFTTGSIVWISGISGGTAWTALNNRYYTIGAVTTSTFRLNSTSTSGWSGNYSSGGQARRCAYTNCEVQITSTAHGFTNSQVVYLTGVNGMTQLNNNAFAVNNVATNTFRLTGSVGPTLSAYTSGGSAWCTAFGCQYFRFQNPSGTWRVFGVTTCVTERVISPDQYTDTAPSTTRVGLNYPASAGNCLTPQIVPLTSDKELLHDTIDAFQAEGSTAGQIGLAWAWYMLAPEFKSLWPTDSQPADYNAGNLMKVVVLMTDGSFNSVYCNGVISADSISGSGSASDHINCNATNGEPFAQAYALCDAMKADTGIKVYTVGFDIAGQTEEEALMTYCASDANKVHLASTEEELHQAFEDIAGDIMQLRISQ